MSERGNEKDAQQTQQNTSDDVATLYSWANLHGAKYRDFSASRQEARSQTRHRMVEQPADPAVNPGEEASAPPAMVAESVVTEATGAESKVAAPAHTFREAVVEYVRMPAVKAQTPVPHAAAAEASPAELPTPVAAPQEPAPVLSEVRSERGAVPPPEPTRNRSLEQAFAPAPAATSRPEAQHSAPPAPLQETVDVRDSYNSPFSYSPRPAGGYAPRQQSNSRWFALQGFLDRSAEERQKTEPRERRIPTLAVFSLAGGVGKTSLVATLGRALSGQGEQVLLADTSTYGILPFYFGSREVRPGLVRKFSPSDGSPDAEVHLVTVDSERSVAEQDENWIIEELKRDARGSSRVLVDLTTASGSLTRRILPLSPTVLVPVVPDMNSVVSLSAVEQFFHKYLDATGRPIQPFYVLNKFESSLPLHLDLREMLHGQLGERLLPFVIRRSPDMGEALAEGMTVMDYAPESPVADDYRNLAGWMRSVAAPVSMAFRGVRWSER